MKTLEREPNISSRVEETVAALIHRAAFCFWLTVVRSVNAEGLVLALQFQVGCQGVAKGAGCGIIESALTDKAPRYGDEGRCPAR